MIVRRVSIGILRLSSPHVLMLVVVSELVRLISSFTQGRVYRDTDTPNTTSVEHDVL